MDFQEGEILYFDKPLHWTSFKLVKTLRNSISRALGIKKIKVGHAGTLDPLASGVMIICTGKSTKLIESFQYQTKEYIATLRLGPKELGIVEIELLDFTSDILRIRVVCSKGTYIRALARDLGEALGSGAHLIGLVRTRVGEVTLDRCLSVDDIGRIVAEAVSSENTPEELKN